MTVMPRPPESTASRLLDLIVARSQPRKSSVKHGDFHWETAKQVQYSDGVSWLLTKHLKHMECYFDQFGRRIAMSEQTWTTLTFAHGEAHVGAMMKNGVSGMTFLVADASPFADCLLAEATSKGLDRPQVKDLLVQLEEKANALIVEAAGLASSAVQTEIFAVRIGELNAAFADVQDRMAKVAALIDLAGMVVWKSN